MKRKAVYLGVAVLLSFFIFLLIYQNFRYDKFTREKFWKDRDYTNQPIYEEFNRIAVPNYVDRIFKLNNRLGYFNRVQEKIFLFDEDLQNGILDSMGGKGTNPNQIGRLEGLFIQDSTIWVLDSHQNNLKIFSEKGELIDLIRISDNFNKGAVLNKDSLILVLSSPSKLSMVIYNIETNESNNVEKLDEIIKGEYTGMSYEGNFRSGPNGTVVFAAISVNMFMVFDSSGDISVVGRTIDNAAPPTIIVREEPNGTSFTYGRDRIFNNVDFQIRNEFLYILSNITDERHFKQRTIDVYSTKTGDYLESFEVGKNSPRWFYMDDSAIYIATSNTSEILILMKNE